VFERLSDEHAVGGTGPFFIGACFCMETFLCDILVRRRIDLYELQHARHAVVVGDDEAIGRDERCRASTEAHDGTERSGGGVGESFWVELEVSGFQRLVMSIELR